MDRDRGNATSRVSGTDSPMRRARKEAVLTVVVPPRRSVPTRTLAAQLYLLLLHRSLHWGYLLNLSLYLGALSSLPKLATCQKSGAAAWKERERTTALKGQPARSLTCSPSLPVVRRLSEDNGGGEIFWVSLWALNNKASFSSLSFLHRLQPRPRPA